MFLQPQPRRRRAHPAFGPVGPRDRDNPRRTFGGNRRRRGIERRVRKGVRGLPRIAPDAGGRREQGHPRHARGPRRRDQALRRGHLRTQRRHQFLHRDLRAGSVPESARGVHDAIEPRGVRRRRSHHLRRRARDREVRTDELHHAARARQPRLRRGVRLGAAHQHHPRLPRTHQVVRQPAPEAAQPARDQITPAAPEGPGPGVRGRQRHELRPLPRSGRREPHVLTRSRLGEQRRQRHGRGGFDERQRPARRLPPQRAHVTAQRDVERRAVMGQDEPGASRAPRERRAHQGGRLPPQLAVRRIGAQHHDVRRVHGQQGRPVRL